MAEVTKTTRVCDVYRGGRKIKNFTLELREVSEINPRHSEPVHC